MTANKQIIKNFAVNILGCGCPDEVFNTITKTSFTLQAPTTRTIEKILIGNRLLIYLAETAKNDDLKTLISILVDLGVKERDTHAYNRLRLVFYSDNNSFNGDEFLKYFHSLDETDDRTFCHFVKAADIRAVLL